MEPHDTSLTWWILGERRVAFLLVVAAATVPLGTGAGAQTQSAHDTATAYGARLSAKGEPANLNPNRINNRSNNRLDTRLSLRVERYRPQSDNDPTAAFAVRPTDNTRIGTATTLSPSPPASQDPKSSSVSIPPRRGNGDAQQR